MDRSSPLNALPPELRNRMWRYAVVQNEPINVTNTTKKKEPALLATCRQIRDESLQMFYDENAFFCLEKIEGGIERDGNEDMAPGCTKLSRMRPFIDFCEQSDEMRPLLTAPTEKLESNWVKALGVATASFISNFRVQIEVEATSIPTQFGVTPDFVCDHIREQFSKKHKSRFMMNWVLMLRGLGLKPRVVTFVVPDSIITFDDAINKVIGEEWKKRVEE